MDRASSSSLSLLLSSGVVVAAVVVLAETVEGETASVNMFGLSVFSANDPLASSALDRSSFVGLSCALRIVFRPINNFLNRATSALRPETLPALFQRMPSAPQSLSLSALAATVWPVVWDDDNCVMTLLGDANLSLGGRMPSSSWTNAVSQLES